MTDHAPADSASFVADRDEANEMLLVNDIARQVGVAFDRRADHLDLTRSQWKLLSALRRNPGIRQAHLATILEIEPISLVRQLDRMEKAGWVVRKTNPKDRRANELYLTEKVAGIVTEMRALAVNLRREVVAGFTEEEHRTLVGYLTRMKANAVAILAKKDEDEVRM